MSVSIILPTNQGREHVFERTLAAYEATAPDGAEIIIPDAYPTVGEAWNAGMGDVGDSEYVMFAIDDATPHDGWWDAAYRTADAGYIPAPRFEFSDGTLEACGSMGWGMLLPEAPDRTPVRSSPTPFIRREWWDMIGPFAERHYAIDDLWTWKACCRGILCLYRSAFRFTHYHERRASDGIRRDAQRHIAATLSEMTSVTLDASHRLPAPLSPA